MPQSKTSLPPPFDCHPRLIRLPMALFGALEPQYLPPTEDYNSFYELAPFPFSGTYSVEFFPEPILGLDQNGFLSMDSFQTDFYRDVLDPTPAYDAFTSLFLPTQPAATPTDVAPIITAPSVLSDIQPTDLNEEDADYDLDPDFADDFATDPLPFTQCRSFTSAPSSPLSSLSSLADTDDAELVYDEPACKEPESLSGSRKRARVSELPATITIYRRTGATRRSRCKNGDFKNSLERYAFHDDPQHVRCMEIGCTAQFESVNAAIDHMPVAHPCEREPKTKKKSKPAKNPKRFRCVYFECDKIKSSVGDMRRHLISEDHQCKRFKCGDCGGLCQRPDPVKRHQDKFRGKCKGRYTEDQPIKQRARRT
ncbi:uncharacterized protein EV420DRAFT_1499087 [Desarmillaria tabescens]|uniref:C2H2-type domain-containing protein n=1 Tax=Armillaria tabescens TaxID=1929756 RepID=A0AA39NQY2_ARMTA|nr:uncharacterized protein EV420DRAFT_1499087 [Desarmillaria tabescens]KAK0470222.1 hypothetical protein EV420DRAFT_1499087 [Desarmillaria tabescens]